MARNLPADPFGRLPATLPRTLTREGRVELLAEVAEDLIAGRKPDPAAATWVASSILSWLLAGQRSNLARDHLEVAAPERSTATPQRIYRKLCEQRAANDDKSDDYDSSTQSDPDQ